MYYAADNTYGSQTDIGFANTWFVAAFATKAERDEYVNEVDSIAARAVTRKEARKYAKDAGVYTRETDGRFRYQHKDVPL